MKKILTDNLIGKMVKTFIEGFLASLVVTLPTISNLENLELMKNVLIGAIAMGISAALNALQSYIHGKSIRN